MENKNPEKITPRMNIKGPRIVRFIWKFQVLKFVSLAFVYEHCWLKRKKSQQRIGPESGVFLIDAFFGSGLLFERDKKFITYKIEEQQTTNILPIGNFLIKSKRSEIWAAKLKSMHHVKNSRFQLIHREIFCSMHHVQFEWYQKLFN